MSRIALLMGAKPKVDESTNATLALMNGAASRKPIYDRVEPATFEQEPAQPVTEAVVEHETAQSLADVQNPTHEDASEAEQIALGHAVAEQVAEALVGEASEPDAIVAMRRIVKDRQHEKIFGVLVPLFSASAAVKVWDAMSQPLRDKIGKKLGNKAGVVWFVNSAHQFIGEKMQDARKLDTASLSYAWKDTVELVSDFDHPSFDDQSGKGSFKYRGKHVSFQMKGDDFHVQLPELVFKNAADVGVEAIKKLIDSTR